MPTIKTINQSELNRLVEQLQELREALKPFADFAESLTPVVLGVRRLTDEDAFHVEMKLGKNYVITFADLRRAKAVLDRLNGEDDQRAIDQAEENMIGTRCSTCGNLVGDSTVTYKGQPMCLVCQGELVSKFPNIEGF
jgi:hypothetical protein